MSERKLTFALIQTSVALPLAIPHIFSGMREYCAEANLTSLVLFGVHGHPNRTHELCRVNVFSFALAFEMSNYQGTPYRCMDDLPFIRKVMNLTNPDPTCAHISSLDGLSRSVRTGSHPCTHNNDGQQVVHRSHRALLGKKSRLSALLCVRSSVQATFSSCVTDIMPV